jgi:hypothetical protein
MNRRNFLTTAGLAGLAGASVPSVSLAADAGSSHDRDYYELRQFILDTEDQFKGLELFLKEAAVPTLITMGMSPVGVFYPEKGFNSVYLLIRHKTLESLVTLYDRLAEDGEFLSHGQAFLDAPASAPAFKRMESSLLYAFSGMPKIEVPVKEPGRVFQLRIYESPSVKTNLKKIEMFNDAGEIKLFRETGLNPVFFGQAIVGSKMPNLTYMLAHKNADEQKASWKRFVSHPEWKRLSGMPEYSDKAILCGITNIQLVPAPYSQI